MRIRRISPDDKPRVMGIIERTEMFSPQEVAVAEELIDIFLGDKDQKDYEIYVSEDGVEPTGYVCFGPISVSDGAFDLYWIAVSPDRQRKGIGGKLLKFVEDEVSRRKGRMIVIETSSRGKYAPTQEFYARNSYRLEARIADFYGPGDDRLIFVKRLGL